MSDDSTCQHFAELTLDSAADPPGHGAERSLRADARRNRARILSAADAIFTTKGPRASTEEVATQAGVAIGTVFRHFPTKEALIEAVFVERLRGLVEDAESLLNADDAGAAFFTFFARVVTQTAAKHAFTDALAEAGIDAVAVRGAIARVGKDLHHALGALLVRAQEDGAVRADVRVPELVAVLIGASHAIEQGADRDTRARVLAIVLDGLQPANVGQFGRNTGNRGGAGDALLRSQSRRATSD
jgi:AcrR family transcriptional regulator